MLDDKIEITKRFFIGNRGVGTDDSLFPFPGRSAGNNAGSYGKKQCLVVGDFEAIELSVVGHFGDLLDFERSKLLGVDSENAFRLILDGSDGLGFLA